MFFIAKTVGSFRRFDEQVVKTWFHGKLKATFLGCDGLGLQIKLTEQEPLGARSSGAHHRGSQGNTRPHNGFTGAVADDSTKAGQTWQGDGDVFVILHKQNIRTGGKEVEARMTIIRI
ncbi:MAG: hypothetical protein BWY75_03184 [bacterium ADurb.Bin425]|nr:MAG: hypothetical protein BWY75_03184 [bacterium ADurb.Bin425]